MRGRGCTHQVDALGTLNTPVPFGLPLRLFVEAKHRTSQPVGIDVVRNAFGVLADVNQHCPANASTRRVAYQYSLVSTRGFTKHAVAYARTHGIALHDFSGDAWRAVRDTVDLAVEVFAPLLAGAGGHKAVPLSSLRRLLRAPLATLQRSQDDDPSAEAAFDHASIERRVRAEAVRGPVKGTIAPAQVKSLVPLLVELAQRHDRSLLIGYPDGQLLLALRPDHTDDLDTLLAKHARTIWGVQVVRVRLAFSPVSAPGELPAGEGDAGEWVVEPDDRSGDFRLRVGLPQGFERTLLTTDGAAATRGERTGSIAIYRHGTPYRLEFALEVRTGSPEDDDERPPLRSERAEKALAITPAAQAPEGRGRTATRRADAAPTPASAPAPARPERADRPVPVDAPAPEPEEDTSWDDDEVKALLALLEQQATAAPGKRRSSTLEDKRQAAEEALGLLHALAKARGELSREEVCLLLGTDPGQRFSRRAGAVTSATKTLKRRGVVARSRGDVLVSDYKGRRAGSNGVTHVHVRAEFIKPLRSRARRLAQAQQSTPSRVGVKPPTASRAAAAVPRQRTRAAVTR